MTKRQQTYTYVMASFAKHGRTCERYVLREHIEGRISYAKYMEAFRAGLAIHERPVQA